MQGIELCRRYYEREVRPGLPADHAAALLGAGSEVLGFDDEVSTDHDFGERVQVFHGDAEVGAFFVARLGVDPAGGMSVADWLLSPTQQLATLTMGAVFHDPHGWLERRRGALAWYPDDVWRHVLAAGWLRIGQEAPFVGRTGSRGDDIGSAVLSARLARDVMKLAFLIERRWAPYPKWLGTAFARLDLAADLTPHLRRMVSGGDWREREAALASAGVVLGTATNALGLAAPVDPQPVPFYTRGFLVPPSEAFVTALAGAGRPIPGAVDQVSDSTDILSNTDRCRAASAMLLGS